jgi:hypothetical protein
MRYLNTFKIFESLDLESEIREIFLSVSDVTQVKFAPYTHDGKRWVKEHVSVSIGLSHRITPDESGTSKWGVKYKQLIAGDELAEEIANSISICMGMGLRIERAEVHWVNAGEWKLANSDKQGTGPGLLTKIFQQSGIVGSMDMIDRKVTKSRYSPEILPEFIIDKGTRLRHIQIVFTK